VNNILVAIMLWLPSGAPMPAEIEAFYIKATYSDEAQCEAARTDARFMWSTIADTTMIGKMDCSDGQLPTNISVGTMNVTVEP